MKNVEGYCAKHPLPGTTQTGRQGCIPHPVGRIHRRLSIAATHRQIHIQKLIHLKHNHSALSYGDYTQIGITNTACIYQRQDEKECLWICMNMKNEVQTLGFNGQGNFIDIETNEELPINNALEFKPYEVRILKRSSD